MADSDQIEQLHDQLAKGIASLRDSQRWQQWLDAAAMFHDYSWRNTLLVLLQCPHATQVAGYRAWQQLGRQVQRGETAIRILGPRFVRETRRDEDGEPVPDEDGEPITDKKLVGWLSLPVFDISQTEGEELPRPAVQLDGEGPEGAYSALAGFADRLGFEVRRRTIDGPANGFCDHDEQRLTLARRLSGAQAVKTLAHELAHALMHSPDEVDYHRDRPRCECEAESVAYVVCGALGLDTGSYSFGYVATWTDEDRELIEATAEAVATTAQRILTEVGP